MCTSDLAGLLISQEFSSGILPTNSSLPTGSPDPDDKTKEPTGIPGPSPVPIPIPIRSGPPPLNPTNSDEKVKEPIGIPGTTTPERSSPKTREGRPYRNQLYDAFDERLKRKRKEIQQVGQMDKLKQPESVVIQTAPRTAIRRIFQRARSGDNRL